MDFDMDTTFAKRLQKQQLHSPTSALVPSPCKRHCDYNVKESYIQSMSEKCIENEDALNFSQSNESYVNNTLMENECSAVIENEASNTKETVIQLYSQNQQNENVYYKYDDDTSLRVYNKKSPGDRFIPSRVNTDWLTTFSNQTSPVPSRKELMSSSAESENIAYTSILRNELLKDSIEEVKPCNDVQSISSPASKKLFQYSPSSNDCNIENQSFSVSPVGLKSQKLLRTRYKTTRKIPKLPYKVLDAPELQNDFYLNLVDWSSQNMLSVGLGASTYLWSANNSQVFRLCDLTRENNSVTSVAWNDKGNWLAVGTYRGTVQIWDVATSKKVLELAKHSARVGAAAWNSNMLATGSKDRRILVNDLRTSIPAEGPAMMCADHRQEVCGLKWSPDGQHLASGGNDNCVNIWSRYTSSPLYTFKEHNAAVKALAWSPHQHGLLATGGGTADRCIRFWNTLTGHAVQSVDTGSQVCNLAWSKNSTELVSTHGYSQNQIVVWKYPSLNQVVNLTGHSCRVLYLALSPDGESIVTGAGDETLRFWNIFSKSLLQKEHKSALSLYSYIR